MHLVRTCSLASGSSGNCLLIQSEQSCFLIDAGVSCRRIEKALQEQGLDPSVIQAVFVTHEHTDHIAGLSTLCRRYDLPIYTNVKTYEALRPLVRGLEKIKFVPMESNTRMLLGDFSIRSFSLSHDAVDPMGFRVDTGSSVISVLTDCGCFLESHFEAVKGSDLIYLEANYDEYQLWHGPYAPHLKARISGDLGHLSNHLSGGALVRLAHAGTRHFCLSHLSETNNDPLLAFETVKQIAEMSGFEVASSLMQLKGDVRIEVSPRHTPSPWWTLKSH